MSSFNPYEPPASENQEVPKNKYLPNINPWEEPLFELLYTTVLCSMLSVIVFYLPGLIFWFLEKTEMLLVIKMFLSDHVALDIIVLVLMLVVFIIWGVFVLACVFQSLKYTGILLIRILRHIF